MILFIVLNNVKIRYNQQQIYTYSGIVLIALNPFQNLPIYTPDIMRACKPLNNYIFLFNQKKKKIKIKNKNKN